MYNTSLPVLLTRILPHYLRGKTTHLFLSLAFLGLQVVKDLFDAWREATDYKLTFTSQVVVLEQYLNELFDPSGTAITVTDGTLGITYLYNIAEAPGSPEAVYNMDEDEVVPILPKVGELVGNFVVTIPDAKYSAAVAGQAIQEKIDFFCPAGMTYFVRSDAYVAPPLAIGEGYDPTKDLYNGGGDPPTDDTIDTIPQDLIS